MSFLSGLSNFFSSAVSIASNAAIATAINFGISYAVNALFKEDSKEPDFVPEPLESRAQMVRDPIGLREIVYGECRKSGGILHSISPILIRSFVMTKML